MKIAQIYLNTSIIGGTEKYIFSISEELKKAGHHVYLIASKHGVLDEKKLFPLYTIDFDDDWDLYKAIEEIKPDIIHLHNFFFNPRILKKYKNKIPIIITIHDTALFCRNLKILPFNGEICNSPLGINCLLYGCYSKKSVKEIVDVIKKCFYKNNFNITDKILVASYYMKDLMAKNKVVQNKIELLPLFVNEIKNSEDENLIKADKEENTVLFVGRIEIHKGLDYLIKALALIKNIDFKLLVVGDGGYLNDILSLAKESNLESNIKFCGWAGLEEISRYYKMADLVIVPSLWPEPFGLVGLEAMSFKKPVVAFEVGAIREWLSDGLNGFLVKRKNIIQLAEKIELLLNDRNLAFKMGKKGYERLVKGFSLSKHMDKLIGIYREEIFKLKKI